MKVALHTRVRADRIGDYEQAHSEVPGELADAIRAAGVSSWTIWRSATDLTGAATFPCLRFDLRADGYDAVSGVPNYRESLRLDLNLEVRV